MQKSAEERVNSYMKEAEMLQGAGRVIAGVSGGADSVFLFFVLLEACRKVRIPFEVIHVHHGIRKEEADRDARFVAELCEEHHIPCTVVRRNIPKEAKEKGITLEEAGRNARYGIFYREASRIPNTRVALAHHKNDAAETLLFNLARGTGLSGLGSLRGVRDGYIRPLLALTRDEIEEELRNRRITWCEDSTNGMDDAARNRIRHHVIPVLQEEINTRTVDHMAETARICGEAADFIQSEAARRSEYYLNWEEKTALLSVTLVDREVNLMREEIVRYTLTQLLPSLKDISSLHIRLILELFERETGKFLNLPKGLTAEKRRGSVALTKLESPKKSNKKQ